MKLPRSWPVSVAFLVLLMSSCGPPGPITLELPIAKPSEHNQNTEVIAWDVLAAACRDGSGSTRLVREDRDSETYRVRCPNGGERTVIVKYGRTRPPAILPQMGDEVEVRDFTVTLLSFQCEELATQGLSTPARGDACRAAFEMTNGSKGPDNATRFEWSIEAGGEHYRSEDALGRAFTEEILPGEVGQGVLHFHVRNGRYPTLLVVADPSRSEKAWIRI